MMVVMMMMMMMMMTMMIFNEGPSHDKDACKGYEASASAVRAHAADIR